MTERTEATESPAEPTAERTSAPAPTARELADEWVRTLADLEPTVATALGLVPHDARMPDLSPDGSAQRAAAARDVLDRLADARVLDDDDRRCATLLRERLEAALAVHDTGEDLASLRPLASPVHTLQSIFLMMPTATTEDWETVAQRLERLPETAESYRTSLEASLRHGPRSAPRQASAVVDQLGAWLTANDGAGWHAGFVAGAPDDAVDGPLRSRLEHAAAGAAEAIGDLRRWIRDTYLTAVADVPDGVGRERYLVAARYSIGADLDPEEAYAWGWAELRRIEAEMAAEAEKVLPGADLATALAHLSEHGPAVDGVEEVRVWLQQMMDRAIADMDGTLVDIPEPARRVEAMIAPAGAAPAPYYTRPSLDFSRPGRTWLPTLGRTRFPTWDLISTWYHEGVPGHHLQLATWAHRSGELSMFQTSVGSLSANTEGWALYAERLVDELGYLDTPAARLGMLDGQRMRAARVVLDIGMHLGLTVPDDDDAHPGEVWTAELGEEFLLAHSGMDRDFLRGEIVRYLGWPGQAISYKLGERAWLAGRATARSRAEAEGREFDLKAWHNAALALGSLGLDDLERELSAL